MLYLKLLVAAIFAVTLAFVGGSWYGSSQAKKDLVIKQLEHNEQTRKTYDTIKKKAPTDNDKSAAIKWLSERASK